MINTTGEDPGSYGELLKQSNAQFINTNGGSSLVVVDEGAKSHDEIAKEIDLSFSFDGLRPQAVSAVFIRDDESSKFQSSFNRVQSSLKASDQVISSTGFERFSSHSVKVELATISTSGKKGSGLQEAISKAAEAGMLLVIIYGTLDQVIDAIGHLKDAPDYLTLLAPYSKANSDYFERWTASKFYSLGSIAALNPQSAYLDSLVLKRLTNWKTF